jgi:type IV pilus assembly protein PilX
MKPDTLPRRQRGFSLLVALLFLVILAMLGITVANVNSLEERMAGHTRDRDLALQAAEAALRDAEVRLQSSAFRTTVKNCGACDFDPDDANTPAYWAGYFGTIDATPCATCYNPVASLPTTGPGAVAFQPEFVVEEKPPVGSLERYRVTARGVGGTIDAVVILQAEFTY